MHEQGANVVAHDPAVTSLPPTLASQIRLAPSAVDALTGASALVIATSWPEYATVTADAVAARMPRPLVLDANRFAWKSLGTSAAIQYLSVGTVSA